MNKMMNVCVVFLIVSFPVLSFAKNCQSSYMGKDFYFASLRDTGGVTCGYRYCYYGCITESYQIPGHYEPSPASMSHWNKVDGGYACYDESYRCEFVAK